MHSQFRKVQKAYKKPLNFCKNRSKYALHVREVKKLLAKAAYKQANKRELTSFESSSFTFGDSRLQPLNSLCKETHIL